MCIVALAWQVLDDCPLLLISNRDEFYQRPASPLHAWQDVPIYAGQDLQQGGTWLGMTAQGRWAIVTNHRDATDKTTYPTSRGDLVKDFLLSTQAPIRFAQQLEQVQQSYAGFNLFLGDTTQAVYMSNRGEAPQVLVKGVYVLSNGILSDDWHKTAHLRKRFTQELLPLKQLAQVTQQQCIDVAWDILQDERKLKPEQLPKTGLSDDMELLLSSTFIQSPVYGTRCSNYIEIRQDKDKAAWQWIEKTQHGEQQGCIVTIEKEIIK